MYVYICLNIQLPWSKRFWPKQFWLKPSWYNLWGKIRNGKTIGPLT